jgi:hypothetical protein
MAASRPPVGAYLFAFLSIPLLGLLFPFFAERLPCLRDWSASYYTEALDQSYAAKGINADVVIVGDSTALFGPDVRMLSRTLGLKVINLPQIRPSMPLQQERPIWRYLRANKAPKLLVYHVAPWDLNVIHRPEDIVYEGVEDVVRNGGLSDWVSAIRLAPQAFLHFPLLYYRMSSGLNRMEGKPLSTEVLKPDQGHVRLSSTTGLLSGSCSFSKSDLQESASAEGAEEIQRHFTTDATRVLVYLSPLPACSNVQQLLAMLPGRLHLAQPLVLPPSNFAANAITHPSPDTEQFRTRALAEAIQQALQPAGDASSAKAESETPRGITKTASQDEQPALHPHEPWHAKTVGARCLGCNLPSSHALVALAGPVRHSR